MEEWIVDKEGGRFMTLQGPHLVLPFFVMVADGEWMECPSKRGGIDWNWGRAHQQGMQHKCDLINVFGILHAVSLYFDGFGCDFFFVKFWWEWKSRLFWILGGLPCRHMNDQRAWPNTWNHSSKRSLCSFWLWSFILYALNSLHPDGGQLQPVFWFMPSNLNPFKLPLLANSQCVVISKSHYLPSAYIHWTRWT